MLDINALAREAIEYLSIPMRDGLVKELRESVKDEFGTELEAAADICMHIDDTMPDVSEPWDFYCHKRQTLYEQVTIPSEYLAELPTADECYKELNEKLESYNGDVKLVDVMDDIFRFFVNKHNSIVDRLNSMVAKYSGVA